MQLLTTEASGISRARRESATATALRGTSAGATSATSERAEQIAKAVGQAQEEEDTDSILNQVLKNPGLSQRAPRGDDVAARRQ